MLPRRGASHPWKHLLEMRRNSLENHLHYSIRGVVNSLDCVMASQTQLPWRLSTESFLGDSSGLTELLGPFLAPSRHLCSVGENVQRQSLVLWNMMQQLWRMITTSGQPRPALEPSPAAHGMAQDTEHQYQSISSGMLSLSTFQPRLLREAD